MKTILVLSHNTFRTSKKCEQTCSCGGDSLWEKTKYNVAFSRRETQGRRAIERDSRLMNSFKCALQTGYK